MSYTINTIILSITLLSCAKNPLYNSQNVSVYKEAQSMIIDKESSNVKVSEELVNFSNYAFFFIDSLEDEDGFTDEDFIDIDASKLDGKLINPKSFKFHHDGNIITFFSGIKNSYFFAEVFHDSKEIKSYDTIPPFGTSKVYLFKVNSDNEVALIEIKEMSYG